MIIDVHGHYTTAPRQLSAWRQRQIASAGIGEPARSEMREYFEKLYREFGEKVTA